MFLLASTATSKKPPMATLIHPDQHDQLMAEFRKVHKKMFNGNVPDNSSTEDEAATNSEIERSNRSYEETLVKGIYENKAFLELHCLDLSGPVWVCMGLYEPVNICVGLSRFLKEKCKKAIKKLNFEIF